MLPPLQPESIEAGAVGCLLQAAPVSTRIQWSFRLHAHSL